MRRLAPRLLVTAKTRRWTPEGLRTLVEAEITARDASNARTRLKAAAFPVTKTLTEFDLGISTIPKATFDYLGSLESIRPRRTCACSDPPRRRQVPPARPRGRRRPSRHRVRYFTAAELVETLYRGLADDSVGKVIDTQLRNQLIIIDELGFAPLDDTGAELLFRFVAAAFERRALGIAGRWPFESWSRLPEHTRREHARPPPAPRQHGHHRRRVQLRMRRPEHEEVARRSRPTARGGDFSLATSEDCPWP